ncbi:hypothetical protein GCM10023185_41300 [Hymenobacter saemangeumensis]|uniref:Outer membrane protein beta-barrel domain-containing protein n=1 Tax=Hymenobacter saemangeumensis TaxID=1084522 RepID=A0ABP8IRT6_9BACT
MSYLAADQATGLTARPVRLLVDALQALPTQLAGVPAPPPAPQPEPLRQPRLYLGVLGAPDVSTVKMADYQAPQVNLGLLVEYRISKRLRLNTGLLRGTKVYRARREDYSWSNYSSASSAKFEWVDGSCTIFDVPLNLRYDLVQRPRYHVFTSVGLSSLFMQREKYAYDYTYDSIPPNPYPYPGPSPNPINKSGSWQKEYVNENQHWFSVLNLSFGYERRLGQHWSVQAEPYVKIPLGGVGAGKVRLASGGVFLGLKYGF